MIPKKESFQHNSEKVLLHHFHIAISPSLPKLLLLSCIPSSTICPVHHLILILLCAHEATTFLSYRCLIVCHPLFCLFQCITKERLFLQTRSCLILDSTLQYQTGKFKNSVIITIIITRMRKEFNKISLNTNSKHPPSSAAKEQPKLAGY